ncbi:DUF262 domain-containing protein [Bradyrhizobium sp. CCBAU 25338]|uniref:DUF262 domain-containing protein n=1 Tax=Bradyrhizobium sp. CCBAU 25338 TaxID=1641877 RepID=UPI002303E3E7|nr:DUF262 domain-containing protein [Bradyrhizobium sp. CCBAU 25338]MDA9530034.1 hypothetical protein [Bradyrhizobium sp. CCBAU 25338]
MARRPVEPARPSDVLEEYDENEPTGVELDPEDDSATVVSPYDPRLIRVDPKVYSVRQVIDMIDDQELDLAPDFQRRRVWRVRQKSLLIESILLRIPLPAFYFSADAEGRLQVVDGVQRLSTIYEFVRDRNLPLDHLEYLGDELQGKTYNDIEGTIWSRRILNTQISANVIDPQTPVAVKFDIFRRINTGGSPLNSQEIRHCMSKDRSRQFLRDLCDTAAFRETMGSSIIDHVRMVDRELALRFTAFKLIGDIANFKRYGSMDEFLTEINQLLDNSHEVTARQLRTLADGFVRAMENARLLFGQHAFRKWPEGYGYLYPINRALFDVWSVALSDISPDRLERMKGPLVDGARSLMTNDGDFISAISTGTSSPQKIITRFDRVLDLVRECEND